MKISELKPNQGKVDVEAEIVSVEEPRTFNKFGKDLTIVNAIVKDDSGEIKVGFWNDDAPKAIVGKKIKITNGYVSEFKGEKQLSAGKFGKLEVLE